MFFLMIVGLYTSRVVLQALGVVDFGIYGVVGGVVSSLAVFSNSLAESILSFPARSSHRLIRDSIDAHTNMLKGLYFFSRTSALRPTMTQSLPKTAMFSTTFFCSSNRLI